MVVRYAMHASAHTSLCVMCMGDYGNCQLQRLFDDTVHDLCCRSFCEVASWLPAYHMHGCNGSESLPSYLKCICIGCCLTGSTAEGACAQCVAKSESCWLGWRCRDKVPYTFGTTLCRMECVLHCSSCQVLI